MKKIDVIIIGCGHAGLESALIIAKKNFKVLLITNNIDNIGNLSCNPSIGGTGKGNLVKEINSLGGIMGVIADKSGIQFKTLNLSKNQYEFSTRIQVDRLKYKKNTYKAIKSYKNIIIKQETVKKLLIKNNNIKGVKTNTKNYFSEIVIITTGTFLNGEIFIGFKKYKGGRINDLTSNNLANQLKEFNYYGGRLKTGTPPRIEGKSINFSYMKKQKGDNNPIPYFSEKKNKKNIKQALCWITKTNEKTHEIIKKSLRKSPIFNKNLSGVSPRYCPSIEDKIYKFYNKKSHNIFVEPESIFFSEYYPNGISTCLPYKIQEKFLKSIKGFENSKITRPGYGVEYDFFNPKGLKKSLESKIIKGLFLAGQINGTTGYEEAAAQGLIAGLNALSLLKKKKEIIINKNHSAIGIMINDLIKNGVDEPYRILTNKFNNKILIRENNSMFRLFKYIKINKINKNFINKIFYNKFIFNLIKIKKINLNLLNLNKIKYIKILEENFLNKIKKKNIYNDEYSYSMKNKKNKNKYKNFKIKNINYFDIKELTKESREKLNKIKPKNLNDLLKNSLINNNTIKSIINKIKN